MVRNLGVKETRCPPCRSDFSELQLCHAKSNEQRFATSNNSACSRLRLWRQLLRCKISFSLLFSLVEKILFFSFQRFFLRCFSGNISQRFEEHVSPSNPCPAKKERSFGGRVAKVSSFFFPGWAGKSLWTSIPVWGSFRGCSETGERCRSPNGVWPFLTGQREGGRERMEREKSRNGRYFSCKEEKPLCHRIFHFSKSFAIYFHVSRFFHLWSRDTKYGGKSERLKRFKSLESKTLPEWFLRRWVRKRKRDFLFFFLEEVQATTNHYVYPTLVAW